MAKKSKGKLKKGGKKSLLEKVKGGARKIKDKAQGVVTGKKGKGGFGGRRRKKSALWFAREIARLKLKKRYEKVRIGV